MPRFTREDPEIRRRTLIAATGRCLARDGRAGVGARRVAAEAGVSPGLVFDIDPDQIDFMQFVPISATESVIREIACVLPDARREMRAARYLNRRIDRQVNREDAVLIDRVRAGMSSSIYTVGPLGESGVSLRRFAAKLRRPIPEARLHRPPPSGWSRRLEAAE